MRTLTVTVLVLVTLVGLGLTAVADCAEEAIEAGERDIWRVSANSGPTLSVRLLSGEIEVRIYAECWRDSVGQVRCRELLYKTTLNSEEPSVTLKFPASPKTYYAVVYGIASISTYRICLD